MLFNELMDSDIIYVFLRDLYMYFVEGSYILAVFQPVTWRTANSCTSGEILLSFACLNCCSLSKIPGSRSR